MPKRFFSFCLLCIAFLSGFANDYEEAWKALHRNDRKMAAEYLKKALKDPATTTDAFITKIYLNDFEGKQENLGNFIEGIVGSEKTIDPYLYALWFKSAVLGSYGKKYKKEQLELLEYIIKSEQLNGSIKAAAHYVKATHHMFSNDFPNARQEWAKVKSILDWQFVGPFENLSGTGFYKDHGPLGKPESTASFSGINNAPIKWFNPSASNIDAWKMVSSHFPFQTAVIYAQTFIVSPKDQDIVLNAGAAGSIKVWVNDALVISESKELVTELDYYRSTCRLNKGNNRILVQLGFTNNATPNFIVRCTDINGSAIGELTEVSKLQPYKKVESKPLQPIQHFSELFFERKIKDQPDNLINYLLLTDVLLRNKRTHVARQVIEKAIRRFPDNSILRNKLILCLQDGQNNTLLSQEVERMKEKDPESFFSYKERLQDLITEEKFEEAEALYTNMISQYGESDWSFQKHTEILVGRQKFDEIIKLVQEGYDKNPNNLYLIGYMYVLQKEVYKDLDKANAIYEKFLDSNFIYDMMKTLGQQYIDQGKKEKGIGIWKQLVEKFPHDASLMTDLAKYYYQQQNYSAARAYCDTVLSIAPFVANYWNNLGIIAEQDGKKDMAIQAYQKTLLYEPNKYEARTKLRELLNKKDLYKQFDQKDPYDIIKAAANKTIAKDYGFSYLLNEKQIIVYGEGGVEEYTTIVVKINTEKGIDSWKESYIPYNSYLQSLLIEKTEVVKPNGSKHQAERDDNELVFTDLQVGDAIVLKYRIQNYSSGRLSADFWDRFLLSGFYPADLIRYSLLINKSLPLHYEITNGSVTPSVRDIEDFKMYTWQMTNTQAVNEEDYMPSITDIAPTLHLSTLGSWDKIVKWYSDLSYYPIENELELKDAYDSIFTTATNIPTLEKAKMIYQYILKNIRYSHVPFRQGAYVPQTPSVTLNTKLGDCKDLSALFVSLAKMAGLKANLLLVDTRDNGVKEMTLPGLEFNHCIVLLQVDGKKYYLELTDNELPFGSLPYNDIGAMSLLIPDHQSDSYVGKLEPIEPQYRTRDKAFRKVAISFNESDMLVSARVVKTGAQTSRLRSEYRNLSDDKRLENMTTALGKNFKNNIQLSELSFTGLDELVDSVTYSLSLKAKNELIEVGDMNMFKIPYGELIATLDVVSKEERNLPFEYWRYEDIDQYETIVEVNIPVGKKIVELPKSELFQFGANTYSLDFKQINDQKLQITRKASLLRKDIAVKDYPALKDFFNKIVKAESKYIAFK
jgi:tetratricopeptide (TPR) repeat protein